MELNRENLSELWNQWIGSKYMLVNGLQRPVNFLGSVQDHKNKFLNFADEFIKEKEMNDLDRMIEEKKKTIKDLETTPNLLMDQRRILDDRKRELKKLITARDS